MNCDNKEQLIKTISGYRIAYVRKYKKGSPDYFKGFLIMFAGAALIVYGLLIFNSTSPQSLFPLYPPNLLPSLQDLATQIIGVIISAAGLIIMFIGVAVGNATPNSDGYEITCYSPKGESIYRDWIEKQQDPEDTREAAQSGVKTCEEKIKDHQEILKIRAKKCDDLKKEEEQIFQFTG